MPSSHNLAIFLAVVTLTLACGTSLANAKLVPIAWGHKSLTRLSSDRANHQIPDIISKSSTGASLPSIKDIASQRGLTLALAENGQMWIWGTLSEELIAPRNVSSSILPPAPIIQIGAADNAFFGLSDSGVLYSWIWGDDMNRHEILGRTTPSPSDPTFRSVVTSPNIVEIGSRIVNFACSDTFCLAYNTSGALHMWISTSTSTLDNALVLSGLDASVPWNSGLPFHVPVPQVSSGGTQKQVVAMATGYNWYFVVTSDLDVYVTGLNTHGRLGLLSISTTQSAVLLPMETNSALKSLGTPQSVSAGRNHAVWVTDFQSGRVYAWGSNVFYQLGNELDSYSATPIEIHFPADEVIVRVSAVWDTSFAITAFGSVYVWGSNTRCARATGCKEASFGMLGRETFSIASATPTLLSFPPGIYSVALPKQSIGFDSSLEDPTRWDHEWAVYLIGEDQNAGAVPSASVPYSYLSWGSHRIWNGSSGYNSIIPATPNSDIIGYNGLRELQLPGSSTFLKGCVFEDSVRMLLWVPNGTDGRSMFSIWAGGRLENEITGNSTIPFPGLAATSSEASQQHPFESVSRLVDITNYQQVEERQKRNISTIALSAHSLVVQSGDGRVMSYNNQEAYERGVFSAKTSIDCARDVCLLLDRDSQLIHSWVDHAAHDGLSYNLLGRSASSQSLVSDNTVPIVIPGTEYISFTLGVDFAVAMVNETTNNLYAWGSNQVSVGGAKNALFEPQLVNTSYLGASASKLNPLTLRTLCAGRAHAAMLFADGTIITWGDNTYGQVGPWYDLVEDETGKGLFPRVLPLSFFTSADLIFPEDVGDVACVRDTTFARVFGDLYVWGLNGPGYNFQTRPDLFSSFGLQKAIQFPYGRVTNRPISSPTAFSIINGVSQRKTSEFTGSTDYTAQLASGFPFLLVGTDNDLENPLTGVPGETYPGVPLLTGDFTSTDGSTLTAFTGNTRFYVTKGQSPSVYVSGDLWTIPTNDPSKYVNEDLTLLASQPRPQLIYEYNANNSASSLSVRGIQAFGEGLVILLSNGTVHYLQASYHPSSDPHSYTLLDTDSNVVYGMQTLLIGGVSDYLSVDASCDYWSCCFRASNRSLWCFGQMTPDEPFKRDSRSQFANPMAYLSESPIFTFPDAGTTSLVVMSSRSGFMFAKIDGTVHWVTVDGTTNPATTSSVVDITGDARGFMITSVTAGLAHVMVLVNDIGLLVSGWNDSMAGIGMPHGYSRVGTPLEPLVPYYPALFGGNKVAEAVAWVYSIVIRMQNGDIWHDGLSVGASHTNWRPYSSAFPHLTVGPSRVPIDPTLWSIPRLHGARAFNEINARHLPNHFVIQSRRVVPQPQSPPPTAPPMVGCDGAPPSTTCVCNSGSWQCTGRTVIESGVVIESPMVVTGDLIISENVAVTINVPILARDGPFITVSGCAVLVGTVNLNIDKDTVKTIPGKGQNMVVIESSCTQTIPELLALNQPKGYCKQLKFTGSQQPASNTRQSIVASFSILKNSCNIWWIVLAAVGGVLVVALPAAALAYLLLAPNKDGDYTEALIEPQQPQHQFQ